MHANGTISVQHLNPLDNHYCPLGFVLFVFFKLQWRKQLSRPLISRCAQMLLKVVVSLPICPRKFSTTPAGEFSCWTLESGGVNSQGFWGHTAAEGALLEQCGVWKSVSGGSSGNSQAFAGCLNLEGSKTLVEGHYWPLGDWVIVMEQLASSGVFCLLLLLLLFYSTLSLREGILYLSFVKDLLLWHPEDDNV